VINKPLMPACKPDLLSLYHPKITLTVQNDPLNLRSSIGLFGPVPSIEPNSSMLMGYEPSRDAVYPPFEI
jgi:hypothetical protein